MMKKIMQYSKRKFESFSDNKKVEIIASFIDSIDRLSSNEPDERNRLLDELEKCLSFLESSPNPGLAEISSKLSGVRSLSPAAFSRVVSWFLRSYGRSLKDYDITPSDRQNDPVIKPAAAIPLSGFFHNLRSAFNVGAMIRTSECFGIQKIYMTGYTPAPDNIKVRKTSMNTTENIVWERADDVVEIMNRLRHEGKELLAIETVSFAEPLHKVEIRQPAVVIVGNEAHGLPEEVLENADKVLKIPLFGKKESLNVGVAYAIACYEILKQWNIIDIQEEK